MNHKLFLTLDRLRSCSFSAARTPPPKTELGLAEMRRICRAQERFIVRAAFYLVTTYALARLVWQIYVMSLLQSKVVLKSSTCVEKQEWCILGASCSSQCNVERRIRDVTWNTTWSRPDKIKNTSRSRLESMAMHYTIRYRMVLYGTILTVWYFTSLCHHVARVEWKQGDHVDIFYFYKPRHCVQRYRYVMYDR